MNSLPDPNVPSALPAEPPSPLPAIASTRWRDRALGAGVGAAIGALAMLGLVRPAPDPSSDEEVTPAPSHDRVTLPSELAAHAGIAVEVASARPIVASTEVVGAVDFDPASVSLVGARVQGRVSELLVDLGQTVERGDAIARVETAELGPALAEWLSAEAELTAARAHETRLRGLASQQLATATAMEEASANVDALEARVRGAEQVLFAMGLSRAELDRARAGGRVDTVTVRAPMDGEVIERPSTMGQVVASTDPIVRIATLDTVWVNLDVYQDDLDRVHAGDQVVVRSESDEETTLTGRVEHVGPIVDQDTRTAHVRIEVPNTDHALRPGQFVRARMLHADDARSGVTVPRDAVLQVGGIPAVFVQVGEAEYEVRALDLGETLDDRVEVRAGVSSGDRVVVAGGFALKSELGR